MRVTRWPRMLPTAPLSATIWRRPDRSGSMSSNLILHGGRMGDQLQHRLNRVSTATLTSQLQRRGIHSTFLSGVGPVKPGQRMLGYAHTLRYVPMREDLQSELLRGQNAQ